jgi:hypothetical protein
MEMQGLASSPASRTKGEKHSTVGQGAASASAAPLFVAAVGSGVRVVVIGEQAPGAEVVGDASEEQVLRVVLVKEVPTSRLDKAFVVEVPVTRLDKAFVVEVVASVLEVASFMAEVIGALEALEALEASTFS